MKKNFPLQLAGKADQRVLDAIKHDIRKYVKRERRKTLPEGFGTWEFDCRIGANAETAGTVALPDLGPAVDAVAKSGSTAVYVEILARASQRPGAESKETGLAAVPPAPPAL